VHGADTRTSSRIYEEDAGRWIFGIVMSEATSHVGDPRAPVLEVIRDGLPRQLRIEAGDEGLAGDVLGEERDAVDGPWPRRHTQPEKTDTVRELLGEIPLQYP